MDSMGAFARGLANRHREQKVFDWEKAAQLIKDRKPRHASAGLSGDWKYTGGLIWADGKPVSQDDTYTYLASTWATPELDMDGEIIPCFRMQSEAPDWNSGTYWPDEARRIVDAA